MAIFETCISFFSFDLLWLKTFAYRSCDIADAPARVKPDTTANIVAKATAEINPNNTSPPTA